jgi:hypothetical protein
MVFNNLYSKLWDFFALIKPEVSKDTTKFNTTQVVDLLSWNWFLVDPTFIVLDLEEEDEGVVRSALKDQVVRVIKFQECIFDAHPLISMKRWKMSKKSTG